jgi:hypothetical protein
MMTMKITIFCDVTFFCLSACTNILQEQAACNYRAEGTKTQKMVARCS